MGFRCSKQVNADPVPSVTITSTNHDVQEGVRHVVLTLGPLGAALCTLGGAGGLCVTHMPVRAHAFRPSLYPSRPCLFASWLVVLWRMIKPGREGLQP